MFRGLHQVDYDSWILLYKWIGDHDIHHIWDYIVDSSGL